MSEKDRTVLENLAEGVNELSGAGHEGMVLAIAASYMAGKEAGMREKKEKEEEKK